MGLVLMISLSAFPEPIDASQPAGFDLVASVNAYRAANGYYALNPNSLVMAAAQAHAEWIVETGQGGHIGADGSNETIRVSWTGYGGGANILCDENWASSTNLNDVIYNIWSDWVHQEVMLNAWGNLYTDIGGGVALQGDGRYVFVLNVCKVYGQEYSGEVPESSGSTPNTTKDPLATADLSNYIYGVTIATPMADGTLRHTVQYGQTLTSIANAYGVTIDALRELNNMDADATIIFPDQELLVRQGTGTIEAQVSATPEITVSPISSATAVTQTQTPQPTLAEAENLPTTNSMAPQVAPDNTRVTPTPGSLVVIVILVGLVVFMYFSSDRK